MKKTEKFLKFFFNKKIRVLALLSGFLFCANLNFNDFKNLNFVKAQDVLNGNLQGFNENEFKLNGFNLKVLKKGDSYKLHYTHQQTNAQFVFDLNNKFERYSSIFFGCPPTDDKGKAHALEHLLASVVSQKLLKKYGVVDPKHFNGNASEYGFCFLISNSIFDLELLENILKELKNPKFLRDKEKIFKKEIHNNYKKDSKAGRMYHEMLNNETAKDFKKIDHRKLNDVRFYNHGGKSEEILKINFKEMEDFFKTYIHPSNMLASFSCFNSSKQIKEVLEFFNENYLKNYSSKNINLNYGLKPNESFYKFVQWDERSEIFRGIDSKQYNYCARVAFNCENFSLNEKNSLNIKTGLLYSILKDEIEKLGYSTVEIDSDGVLKDRFILKFYGNDKSKFSEQALKENSKQILKSTVEFLEKALEYPPNREIYFNFNKVLGEEYYKSTSFNRADKYRKIYDMYDICFLSFVKYKTPFSDKIFKIQNDEIVDDFNNEKQNFEDNFISSLKKLINSNFLFIDFFEKAKINSNVSKKPSEKKINFKINNYKNNDVLRFTEYVLFKNILNNKIDSHGLSYENLKNSPYVGDYPCLKENDSSFESVDKFLKENFKKLIKKFNFNELFFEIELRNYANKLKKEIFDSEQILRYLKANKDFILENKDKKDIVFSRQKFVDDLHKKIKDFKILFDKKEDYFEFKQKKDLFKKKYEDYFKNNLNSDDNYSLFFKEFEEYVDYQTDLFNKVLQNLKEKLNNVKFLNYLDVKKSVESVTYIKS